MTSIPMDAIGICGCLVHYAIFFALLGSALLTFIYLWVKGKLDMDESPKIQMMNQEERSNHETR